MGRWRLSPCFASQPFSLCRLCLVSSDLYEAQLWVPPQLSPEVLLENHGSGGGPGAADSAVFSCFAGHCPCLYSPCFLKLVFLFVWSPSSHLSQSPGSLPIGKSGGLKSSLGCRAGLWVLSLMLRWPGWAGGGETSSSISGGLSQLPAWRVRVW